MGVTVMRFLMIAAAGRPAGNGRGTAMPSAQAVATDYSAKKHKKPMKKAAKMKKEKVDYMRAAPMK
jgi:hypothetical protein